MDRPDDLFDREREWADLVQFVSSGQRGLQIGVVYGRRRQGKSFLLRRLVTAAWDLQPGVGGATAAGVRALRALCR